MTLPRLALAALCMALPLAAAAHTEAVRGYIDRTAVAGTPLNLVLSGYARTLLQMLEHRDDSATLAPLLDRLQDDKQCVNDFVGDYVAADRIIAGLENVVIATTPQKMEWQTVQAHLPLDDGGHQARCQRERPEAE